MADIYQAFEQAMTVDHMFELRKTLRRHRAKTFLATALGTFLGMTASLLVLYLIVINHPFR